MSSIMIYAIVAALSGIMCGYNLRTVTLAPKLKMAQFHAGIAGIFFALALGCVFRVHIEMTQISNVLTNLEGLFNLIPTT